MSENLRAPFPSHRLRTDSDIEAALRPLFESASDEQLWMLFLTSEGRLRDVIMPMDELPDDPMAICETSDLGTRPFAEVFTHRAAELAEVLEAAAYIIVLERAGGEKFTAADIRWAGALADAAAGHRREAGLRALFLLHDGGLRQMAADDYA